MFCRRVTNRLLTVSFKTHSVRPFHSTRVLRDWHQKVDPKTGEFYYYNIFTEEITKIQPREYLPYDARQESPLLKFFRTDSTAPVSGKYPSVRYWGTFLAIFTALFLYEKFKPRDPDYVSKGNKTENELRVEAEVRKRLEEYKRNLQNKQAQ